MSKYTTSVRFICESYAGLEESVGFDDIDRVIEGAVDKVFSWALPPTENVDEWNELKKHILIHFYTREIGAETVGLWKLQLRQKFDGLFDYYDKLISSAKLQFGPLDEVDYTRTRRRDKDNKANTENSAESVSTAHNENTSRNYFSNTPQGQLSLVEEGQYLTNFTKDTGDGKSNSTGKSSGSSKYTEKGVEDERETTKGRMFGKGPSQLLMEYRKTLLRIEEDICRELEPLFFGLW